MNRARGEELRLIAEQAAVWLERFPTTTLREREKFLAWVKTSPAHVREFLAAIVLKDDLSNLDCGQRIDVEAIAASARNNVISVSTRSPR